MTDRDYFVNGLKLWYRATPGYSSGSTTFQNAVAYYEKNASFVKSFAWVMRKFENTKIRAALVDLAGDYGDKYPPSSEFFSYAAREVGTLDAADYADVAVDTAKDVAKVAALGVGLYLVVAAIGLAVLIYSNKGAAKAAAKAVKA